jgi:multidrug efflux pump
VLLSDVSVRRPVLATVISALLLSFGLLSFASLPLRELPDVDPPIVSVETTYTGASSNVVENRITRLLEDRISGIEGIRTISSESRDGRSSITLEFVLEREIEAAANDVRDRVSQVLDDLPDEAEPPEIFKADADSDVIMWFNLASPKRDRLELTDYADRYIVDRLSVLDGVARIRLSGARRYSMRIWLDRVALAARQLTVADVESALRSQNVEFPAGQLESRQRDFTVRVERGYVTAEHFRDLVVARGDDGHLVRLGELARVEVGPDEWRNDFRGNGQPQVGVGIVKQSSANTLAVARAARAEVQRIRPTLPEDMTLEHSWDSSLFIEAAISEVYETLLIALLLVVAVIYLFLGTARAALVPAVTVPISLMATFTVLYALGFSINLLTLLALVLSIGLVVDDSIVVLENIQRRIELGEPPLLAAVRGAREVGFAVIATTVVVIAVFVPIAFLQGMTGRLFRELAITISAAVGFSGVVALSLSAMLCSKLLSAQERDRGLNRLTHGAFEAMRRGYASGLAFSMARPRLVGLTLLGLLGASLGLFRLVPSELEPPEDRSAFFVFMRGPEGANFDYSVRHMREVEQVLFPLRESGEALRVLSRVPAGWGGGGAMNGGTAIVGLVPWDERHRTQQEIIASLADPLARIPGVRAFPSSPGGLGRRGSGRPVQVALGGTNHAEIGAWQEQVLARAAEVPELAGLEGDYRPTSPQLRVEIDHTRAADLGVSVAAIGRTLETMLGSRRVTTYVSSGEEYDVILQAPQTQREQPGDLTNLYVRSDRTGELVPLSNLVRLREVADAASLRRYNRLPAATLEAALAPGSSLGPALDALERLVRSTLPESVHLDYKGTSLEFRASSSAAYFTFALALLIVFLVLSAQFESFVHPLVIMLTVPLAVVGALCGLAIQEGGSLNIYSQIGITILIGLAAKNGILIVEFANQLRGAGRGFREAVVEAAQTRLRPILMTAISTAIGALPLMLASGAGAGGRRAIGVVVFSGVLFATGFTLFVVPVAYAVLARRTQLPGTVARRLEALAGETPGARAPVPG